MSATDHPVPAAGRLTRREREVLDLLWRGHTEPEVGLHLGIATNTVKAHVAKVYRRLRVETRMEAFRAAGYLSGDLQRAVEAVSSGHPLLTAAEVASLLRVHHNTLCRIPPADLPVIRLGTRGDRRYRRSDVEAYLTLRTRR